MGSQVAGVPRDPEVAIGPAAWLREQRRLRGLSIAFVAARTGLSATRLEALEAGRETPLDDDAGRTLLRNLAAALGAEPADALEQLAPVPPARRTRHPRRRPSLPWARIVRWSAAAGVAGALGVAIWTATRWWQERIPEGPPDVVYRTDYIDELLEPPDVAAK